MVTISALAYFLLVFFSGCPSWGDCIVIETRGCPDLYKEQKTNAFFYNPLEMEARSNGRGQCAAFGTIQCCRIFDGHSMKTLAKTPHIIFGSGLLRSMEEW